MYPKLKYLYSIPVSMACMLASCNSDVPGTEDMGPGAELSFTTYEPTRASETPAFDRFAVYGDIKYQTENAQAPIVLFDKTIVEYKNDIWSYEDTQYWVPDREHSFVAITPESILNAGSNTRYLNSRLTYEYSIPATGGNLSSNSDIDDIMVATHRRFFKKIDVTTSPLDTKINLKFTHILSQINFTPAFTDNHLGSDDYILFHKLEFSGVSTKALIDILPATMQSNNQTDDMVLDITSQQRGTITLPFTTPVKVENNAINVNLFADNGSILMLPLNFEADSEAKITFYYTVNGEDLMKQVSIPLNNQKWESGRSYTYKFIIDRTGLKWENCEINPWNRVTGAEITVD
ncbi:MAG: fimbrillin family protein [Duncaniella sp.]|nr:fimbrillin family protein [Duncaniella sp.]